LRFLEIGNLTSIPVVEGAILPLRNTYKRMHHWEHLYGKLAWLGGCLEQSSVLTSSF